MIKLIEEQKIIISHYREGKSQRQISRELSINRRAISKYIKDHKNKKARLTNSKSNCNKDEIIANIVEKPKYDSSSRKKVKLTDKIMYIIKF